VIRHSVFVIGYWLCYRLLSTGPRFCAQILVEPFRREVSDLLQRAGFLEQVRGARNNCQFLDGSTKPGQCVLVHTDDGTVMAADDEQGWRPHGEEGVARQVGPAAARYDGANAVWNDARCHQGRSAARAGAEATDGQWGRAMIL